MEEQSISEKLFCWPPPSCEVVLNAFRKRGYEPYFDYAMTEHPVKIRFFIGSKRCDLSLFTGEFHKIDWLITQFEYQYKKLI